MLSVSDKHAEENDSYLLWYQNKLQIRIKKEESSEISEYSVTNSVMGKGKTYPYCLRKITKV